MVLFAVDRSTNTHYIWPFLAGGELRGRYGISSEHYTLIFNIFVFSQIFNLINSRIVVPWKRNPFSNLATNWLFLLIICAISAVQVFLYHFSMYLLSTVACLKSFRSGDHRSVWRGRHEDGSSPLGTVAELVGNRRLHPFPWFSLEAHPCQAR